MGCCLLQGDLLTSRLDGADTRVLHQLRELLYWYSMDVLQEALYVSQVPAPLIPFAVPSQTPPSPTCAPHPAFREDKPPVLTHVSAVCTRFSFPAARSLGGVPPRATRLPGCHISEAALPADPCAPRSTRMPRVQRPRVGGLSETPIAKPYTHIPGNGWCLNPRFKLVPKPRAPSQ